jgi:hypothetical protein
VAELLAGGGPAAGTVAQGLTRILGESVTLEVERLGVVLARVDSLRESLRGEIGGNAAAQVHRSLLALREGLVFVRDSREAADWAQLGAPMARREATMVAQARSVIAGLPADQNVVLLGHAAHLSKDWPSARPLDTGTGPPPASLGTQLARDHPGQVLSVWLLHGSGSDSQHLTSMPSEYARTKGSLNEALAQVGECFLLPLGPPETLPELRGEQDVRWIYGAGCRTRITAQADAEFFVREATPLPERYRDV